MDEAAGRGMVVPRAALPFVGVAAGLAAGALLGPRAEAGADPAFLALLQFMAIVKSAMALGVAGLAAWRLGWAPGGPAGGYAAACLAMGAGVWPMWTGAGMALGAALVHGGWMTVAALAWRDGHGWRAAWARRRR